MGIAWTEDGASVWVTHLFAPGEHPLLTRIDFSGPEPDRKLIAIEYREFGECIETGGRPEVDGYVGRKALALCNAALESGVLNRAVTLEEIEAERTGVYEAEINAYWKI